MSYTKGPWKDFWGEYEGADIFRVEQEENSITICEGLGIDSDIDIKEIEANVKLIAAAPELLEALEKLHSLLDFEEKVLDNTGFTFENAKGINESFELAYKVINKAKGGNQ